MSTESEALKKFAVGEFVVRRCDGMVGRVIERDESKTFPIRVKFAEEDPDTEFCDVELLPATYEGIALALAPKENLTDIAASEETESSEQDGDVDFSGFSKFVENYCRIARGDRVADKLSSLLDATMSKVYRTRDESEVQTILADVRGQIKALELSGPDFPGLLTEKSLFGIPGDFVAAALPCTEASAETLLFTLLPIIGNILGSQNFVRFGADVHPPALFSLIVAPTSAGKGQALGAARLFARITDYGWERNRLKTSAASGEALIRLAADPTDKRLAIICPEMRVLFDSMGREGSNLSGNLRNAYDGIPLQNNRSKKSESEVAHDYLLSVYGSITPAELSEVMPAVDWSNGVGNRFLWCIGEKSKTIKRATFSPDFTGLAERVNLIKNLPPVGSVDFTLEGGEVWDKWVDLLPLYDDEKLSASQERIRPNCLRVALLYAILDERRLTNGGGIALGPEHIEAAIEIVTRSRESTEWFLRRPAQHADGRRGKADFELMTRLKAAMNSLGSLTGSHLHDKLLPHMKPEERNSLLTRCGFKRRLIKTPGAKGGASSEIWMW